MDTDIEELKQEVEELKALTADTNKTIHKMRRSQRWATILSIVWWLTVAGVSGAVYYYYFQPYIQAIMSTYGDAKDFQVQIQDLFANFGRNSAQ
jgi:hypothetical protein